MTALGQMSGIGTARIARPLRVQNASAPKDLRLSQHPKNEAGAPPRKPQSSIAPCHCGTAAHDVWSAPVLRAGFITQILAQDAAPDGGFAVQRAAAHAYGAPAIRPAVLVDRRV